MCGIAGIFNLNNQPVDQSALRRMVGMMIHRGPDSEGFFFRENFAFGMRRLAVIDLTSGNQPIANENGQIWAIHNGEIYNFLELKEELLQRGHCFRTRSDTEVLVHLYEEDGVNFLPRLNGMFALALWDDSRKRLLLARDRFGVKPLFLNKNRERIIFASEIPALHGFNPGLRFTISPDYLEEYLALYYLAAEHTLFQEVEKLPPAHYLLASPEKTELKRYYTFRYSADKISPEDSAARIRTNFQSAVKRNLLSDVPLGVFLSGGLDSTTIVAMMNLIGERDIKTFTISFPEQTYDERQEAEAVASRYHTEHYSFVVDPKIIAQELPRIIHHLGEPNGDWTMVMNAYLSRVCRDKVTVILCGTGGDELFAGYPTLIASQYTDYYRHLPLFLRSHLLPALIKHLPTSFANLSWDFKLKSFIRGTERPVASKGEQFLRWKEVFSPQERLELVGKHWPREEGSADTASEPLFSLASSVLSELPADTHILNQYLYLDLRLFLAGCLLPHSDIASMLSSLETRVPFLDNELFECSASIPPEYKIRRRQTKYIFRRAFQELLPAEVTWKRKMGFSPPLAIWLQRELCDFARDVLFSGKGTTNGLFNKDYLERIWREHQDGRINHSRKIQALVSFNLWYEDYG